MMNKLYRGISRVRQQLNYLIAKQRLIDKNNQLSKIDIDLERLPDKLVAGMAKGLRVNKKFPAGKSIYIDVEGEELIIEVLYKFRRILDNMDNRGTSGIDIYSFCENDGYCWLDTIFPVNNYQMYVKKVVQLTSGKNRFKLYLPSFAIIEGIYCSCGLVNVSCKNDVEIVAYGSSITQGCAASRPGLNYLNQVANRLNCEIVNYGFSESAKGEEALLNYISSIPTKIFIVEFDHNASIDELQEKHQKAYMTIRRNFNGWIILLSRFSGEISISLEEEKKRINIIQNTYEYATKNGDDRIFFYNGSQLFTKNKEAFFVDKIHPNDKGMVGIANMLCTVITEEGMLK